MTSFVNDKYNDAIAESIPYGLTCQVLNVTASYEYQKMKAFSNEICLNVKHQPFIFFNLLSKFIWTLIDTRWSNRMRDATAAIAGSVVETTHRPGLFHQQHFLVHKQTSYTKHCIAGLVKHLSPYTGRISKWMVFGQRLFAQRKWITEHCSLRDAFSGSVAIFIVDKWRHSDVIVIKLTAVIQN